MRDETELVAFCRQEHPRLVGALSLYCGDRDVAEELAQEALIRLCRDWNKVKKMNSRSAWVHRVGVNLASSYYRRKKAERRAKVRLANVQRHNQTPAINDAEVVSLRRVVDALPWRQKTAIILRYYLDLPIEEIANAMGCSSSTAKAHLRKAIEALRRQHELKEVVDVI